MGGHASTHKGLEQVTKRAESRVGKITVTGRYHRAPKKLEDDYRTTQSVLGSGYNGKVFLAEHRETQAKVAVKAFKLHGVTKDKKEELESEAEIFLGMDHPHVARLVDVYESVDHLSLVMECMTGGELFKRVTERKRFTEKDGADAAWQMLLAVNYIHSHDVVHRDIKLENFLYDSPESQHLKLIDFGFSKIWAHNTKMALSCGTLAYVAPEVLDRSYTSQCDMWSLGVTIFIVLLGYMPFSGSEEHQVNCIKGGRYTVKKDPWGRISDQAKDFIKNLLVVKPADRLTAEQALAHPFIDQRDKFEKSHENIDQGIVDALVDFGKASNFRRAAMSMMAWSLTNDERASVRQAFIELDADRTGTVTAGEFKRVMEERFHISDDEATTAFKALDINHQEEIHYSEFLAAMVSSRIAMHDDLLRATFRRFDTDNTGYISVDNLKEVLGSSFEGEEVDKMLADVDASHDGKIDYQEWIHYLRCGSAQEHHQEAAARFIDKEAAKSDTNFGHKLRQKTDQALAAIGGGGKHSGEEKERAQPKCGCSMQ